MRNQGSNPARRLAQRYAESRHFLAQANSSASQPPDTTHCIAKLLEGSVLRGIHFLYQALPPRPQRRPPLNRNAFSDGDYFAKTYVVHEFRFGSLRDILERASLVDPRDIRFLADRDEIAKARRLGKQERLDVCMISYLLEDRIGYEPNFLRRSACIFAFALLRSLRSSWSLSSSREKLKKKISPVMI